VGWDSPSSTVTLFSYNRVIQLKLATRWQSFVLGEFDRYLFSSFLGELDKTGEKLCK
jgi:hypothetical protein